MNVDPFVTLDRHYLNEADLTRLRLESLPTGTHHFHHANMTVDRLDGSQVVIVRSQWKPKMPPALGGQNLGLMHQPEQWIVDAIYAQPRERFRPLPFLLALAALDGIGVPHEEIPDWIAIGVTEADVAGIPEGGYDPALHSLDTFRLLVGLR